MKPFILVVLLAVVGSSTTSRSYYGNYDFGAYMLPDSGSSYKIVIRSKYYVTEGNEEHRIAAQKGVDFWNGLSRQFELRELDSTMSPTGRSIPICFELTVESCKDPKKEKKEKDSLVWIGKAHKEIRNAFYLVDTIKDSVDCCYIDGDPAETVGLTCESYYIRILTSHHENEIVLAHEIGHSLGLEGHLRVKGLMKQYNKRSRIVHDFEIRKILQYTFGNKLDTVRNHFDAKIPSGYIVDTYRKKNKQNRLHPDSQILFTKEHIYNPGITD